MVLAGLFLLQVQSKAHGSYRKVNLFHSLNNSWWTAPTGTEITDVTVDFQLTPISTLRTKDSSEKMTISILPETELASTTVRNLKS